MGGPPVTSPVKVSQPDLWPSPTKLNCMGAAQQAPPRVHTSANAAPSGPDNASLLGRWKTLRVLSLLLEVKSGANCQATPTEVHHFLFFVPHAVSTG